MIKVKRGSSWADALRSYEVLLDGEVIGQIKRGEEKDFEVPHGPHELAVKIDWCTTPAVPFEYIGEPVHFECGNALKGWRSMVAIVYVLLWPSEYLWLRNVESGSANQYRM
ncbi:MAG: hypothetical protein IPM63_01385 [Acidobacteriota bacterium]|nr:MAG: hypothetical protein IPM63_01385 [Acidobacteriota bacterium]